MNHNQRFDLPPTMGKPELDRARWEAIALDPHPSVEQNMLRDLVENKLGVRWEDYLNGIRELRKMRGE